MTFKKQLKGGGIQFLLLLVTILILFAYFHFKGNGYLTFSDGAKFADIARNIVVGRGYVSNFSFFNNQVMGLDPNTSVSKWVPLTMPFALTLSFLVFGINDLSVIITSSTFFIFLVATTYLLGKKIGGELVGLLTSLAVGFNISFVNYATSGASETFFTFEIVLTAYILLFRKKVLNSVAMGMLILIYLTRPQAIVYILGLFLLYLLLNYQIKKAIGFFITMFIIITVVFFITSQQSLFAITQHLPGIPTSNTLRGAEVQSLNIFVLSKKVLYNLYNFYRLMPQIMSPYLFGLFVISLVRWKKNNTYNALKIASLIMITLTLLIGALTIPYFRYLHPVVPLVYLLAIETLVWIVRKLINKLQIKNLKVYKKKLIIATAFLLVLFMGVGQTIGVIFLDSRSERKNKNITKPPIYVQLSSILRSSTKSDDLVVTNLDTWGSWYGERKTVWFPLEPEMLDVSNDQEAAFDYIYLTSYLMDDENYYMGDNWRQIFNNPENITSHFINEKYNLIGKYEIAASDVFENYSSRAILLRRK